MPGQGAHRGDNISAARKILSTLPDVGSDEGSSGAPSDTGEDDPDLVSRPRVLTKTRRPGRPRRGGVRA